MSIEGFLNATVANIQKKHDELINTPKSRATKELKAEIQDILKYIETCVKCNDITFEFANTIKKKIRAIDFENLAMQRKRREKQNTKVWNAEVIENE